MNSFQRISSLLLMSVLLAGCEVANTPGTGNNNGMMEKANTNEIIIGVVAPLTGEVASIGEDFRNSLTLYAEKNPTWAGSKVRFVFEDGQCTPTNAVSAANKIFNTEKVQVMMVHDCSGPYLAVAPISNQKKVVQISSFSTSPDITAGGGDYGFRNAPSDEKSSDVMVDYMVEKGYKSVAILSENTDFSQGYRKKLQSKLSAKGINLVLDETFNTGTTDFKTVLLKAKDAQADVIVNLPNGGTAAGIISKQKVELGMTTPELGTDVMTAKEFYDIAKSAANGMVFIVTAVDPEDKKIKDFITMYQARFGKAPTSDAYAALSWDSGEIIKRAVEAVGYDGEKMKNWLYQMPELDGLAGKTTFDSNGDSSILPKLMVVTNGKAEILK